MLRKDYAKLLDNAVVSKCFIESSKGSFSVYLKNILWVKGGIELAIFTENAPKVVYLSSRDIKQIIF